MCDQKLPSLSDLENHHSDHSRGIAIDPAAASAPPISPTEYFEKLAQLGRGYEYTCCLGRDVFPVKRAHNEHGYQS